MTFVKKNHIYSDFIPSRDEIHLWHVDLTTLYGFDALNDLLNTEEKARYHRFYFDKHRALFAASRKALRLILAKYLLMSPAEVTFDFGRYGKPELSAPFNDLHFNMSHTKTHCLIGISLMPLGVDIEAVSKRDYFALAKFSFSQKECDLLRTMPEADIADGFFRIWSQKEAFIKQCGRGLNYPLKSFSCSPIPPETLLSVTEGALMDYWLYAYKFNVSTFAAVCLKGTAKEIKTIHFDINSHHYAAI